MKLTLILKVAATALVIGVIAYTMTTRNFLVPADGVYYRFEFQSGGRDGEHHEFLIMDCLPEKIDLSQSSAVQEFQSQLQNDREKMKTGDGPVVSLSESARFFEVVKEEKNAADAKVSCRGVLYSNAREICDKRKLLFQERISRCNLRTK